MKYVRNPVIDDLDVGCCFLLLTVGIWGTYCVCSPRGSFFANLNFDFIKNLKDNRLHVNCDSPYMSIYNKAVQITILRLMSSFRSPVPRLNSANLNRHMRYTYATHKRTLWPEPSETSSF